MSRMTRTTTARRSFLARFGGAAAAFGAALVAEESFPQAQAQAQAPVASAAPWQPARHPEDDWFEQVSAKHRVFFDTTTASGFSEAVFFANNSFTGNKAGYGLADADIALVICARHQSTPFAFNDAMWAKYGASFAERSKLSDALGKEPLKEPPTANPYLTAAGAIGGASTRSNGVTLDALIKRGVRLAVCGMATRASASLIARKTGGDVDAVFKELTEHMVPNAHLVPAGIVAVNRAQERGYSLVSVA